VKDRDVLLSLIAFAGAIANLIYLYFRDKAKERSEERRREWDNEDRARILHKIDENTNLTATHVDSNAQMLDELAKLREELAGTKNAPHAD
jgi:hypothetical protein